MVMINTLQEVVDLDGNAIPENAEQNLTLGRAMSNALMAVQQRAPGQAPGESEKDSLDHYLLALRLRDKNAIQPVLVSVTEAALILKKAHENMAKLVYAQVKLALDPPEKPAPAPLANGHAANDTAPTAALQ